MSKDKLNDKLYEAIMKGKISLITSLFEKGAEINANLYNDNKPLHVAVRQGYKDIAELLIQKGADVNAENKYKETPLHAAITNGSKEIFELLIRNKGNVNVLCQDKSTLLHSAAFDGNRAIAELLIQKGLDVNAREANYGETPLHKAARYRNRDVAQLLIQKGAGIIIRNNNGETALDLAKTGTMGIDKSVIDLLQQAESNLVKPVAQSQATGSTPNSNPPLSEKQHLELERLKIEQETKLKEGELRLKEMELKLKYEADIKLKEIEIRVRIEAEMKAKIEKEANEKKGNNLHSLSSSSVSDHVDDIMMPGHAFSGNDSLVVMPKAASTSHAQKLENSRQTESKSLGK